MRNEFVRISGEDAAEARAQCPSCGAALRRSGEILVCALCAAEGRIAGNVIDWRTVVPDTQSPGSLWRTDMRAADNARRLIRAARYCLHPVASPLSPLAWLTRARLRRYYERTRSDPAMAQEWAAHYLAELPRRAGMAVLDHGTGRGRNLGLLAQLGCRIAAQDVAPHEGWSNFPQSQFQIVPPDFDHLPWRAAEFDLVLDCMVVEYFSLERLARLAGEVARVLKSGGHWLVLTPNVGSYAARALRRTPGRLHAPDAVIRLACDNGFGMVRQSYEGFYAPLFPILFDAIRKNCAPWPLDVADYRSTLARLVPPRRRAVWVAVFQKS